ncbi:MAG TPA: EAL domain-containing protein [Acidobacteriota bacterium]|nr:EAL domain-containing protein [Acidobacteriota bacterium]
MSQLTESKADSAVGLRHPAYLPYMHLVIGLGSICILYAVWQVLHQSANYQWVILASLTVITSPFSIKIPTANSKISIGDTLYFTNVVLFGPAAGIITAALDGLLGSLSARTGSRCLQYTCFNVAAMSVSSLVGGTVFFGMLGREPLYFRPLNSVYEIILPLSVLAFIHYFLNSGSVAIIVALELRTRILQIWRDSFLWTSITYFAGAAAAGLIAVTMGSVTPQVFAIAVPVLLAVYYTYKTYLNKVQEVRSLAYYDSLTMLPNRLLFKEHLDQALRRYGQSRKHIAVMFLDLDNFKRINDTFGHSVGDLLIRSVGARLSTSVRMGERDLQHRPGQEVVIGRFGGDEFTVLLTGIDSPQDAAKVADRLIQAFTSPFSLDGQEVSVGASVGVSVFPYDGIDADVLLRKADTAMFHAKADARSSYHFYSPAMDEASPQRLSLENEMRQALGGGEFRVHYQPIANAKTGVLTKAEALVRWLHPTKGLLSATEFISLAEQTGLIRPVGEWMLRTVCAQIGDWQQAGLSPVPVAVNMSAGQFRQPNLARSVAQVLRETGVDPCLLELELAEDTIMQGGEETDKSLQEMRDLGIRVSVDNFGAGYSSLSRLRRLALDGLKIDRSFVAHLAENPDDRAVTAAIITMAGSLKLRVIAEGVETEGQMQFLRKHGCDELQGWLPGRPMPADEFAGLLDYRHRFQPLFEVHSFFPSSVVAEDQGLAVAGLRAVSSSKH